MCYIKHMSAYPNLPKVYISKYALTKGILLAEDAALCTETMIRVGAHAYYHKPDWHLTLADAQAHAEGLKTAKIKSVKKQMEKLETLGFAKVKPHG